jgi:hypothetical protein
VYGVGPLLFYLLTLDRQVSRWEGMLFVLAYGLFIMELVRLVWLVSHFGEASNVNSCKSTPAFCAARRAASNME